MTDLRVLAVDGVASVASTLAAREAFAVAVATDDRSLASALADEPFQCIVIEHDPPAVDAVETTRTVVDVSDAPVVVRDRTSDAAVAGEVVAAGAAGYVPASADSGTLAERVQDLAEVPSRPDGAAQRRYEAIVESLADPVWVVDEDGYSVFANEAYEEAFGYSKARAMRGDLHFEETLTAASADRIREVTEAMMTDGLERATVAVEMVTADGSVVPVEDHFAPLHDADGEFRGAAGVARDVSDRERRERRLQVLNRVLRHNLGNDLTTITGYAALLAADATTDVQRERARTVQHVAERLADASRKVRQLGAVVDHDPRDRTVVDVVAAVDSAVANVHGRHADADVTVDAPEVAHVHAHRHLERAIEQLVENAVEHGSPCSRTESGNSVEHGSTSDGPATVRVSVDDDPETGTVTVSVADDGPGLPEDERAVVLDDGEITPTRHGTGLGLWIAKWAVDSAGGELFAPELADGDGGVVAIRLDRARVDPT
ncbi:sensor histidine kinase [Halorubellus salinus]|uniref:sensor histidine kinase n=1 Tax=Halorubellus salinus TaxID=755309 RepID=UPI001D060E7D|nr:PAS domain-containing sensor histidine kinase [Halorubellus salinus]